MNSIPNLTARQGWALRNARILAFVALTVVGIVGLISCSSTPTPIPTDMSPAKYFQTVQEFFDTESYDDALRFLVDFETRHADSQDPAIKDRLLEGQYLIAQISYKRGKLTEALELYTALLHKYDGLTGKEASPPQWIKVLCTKMIATINKKLPKPTPTTSAEPAASPEVSPSPSPAASPAASPSASPAASPSAAPATAPSIPAVSPTASPSASPAANPAAAASPNPVK